MRKVNHDFDNVKSFVQSLEGKSVKMLVNKGRKRYVRYYGILESAYHAVFMVRLADQRATDILTYSYSDVLCGDVKLSLEPSG
ncbi:MAG: Veg family protein [Firmicutes bacterium]|nr:Veg family protein [Bacillota bacterium]